MHGMMVSFFSSNQEESWLKQLFQLEDLMKQKIVIEVPLNCAKCKRKVMTICTTAEGVTSVKFLRDGRDRVEIIGEGVDASEVTESSRENVKYAHLVNVAKVEGS